MTVPVGAQPSPSLRPIGSRSVAVQVTDEIRRSILSGALAPGQLLSLRKLADVLEVSFIPVRDAIKTLEGEGLVVNPPGRSASVAPIDLEEFHSIYRIRRMLEPELSRRSCLLLSDDELDALFEQAGELGRLDRTMQDIYDDHRAFHRALLAPAISAWDERILTMLWQSSERYVRIGFGLLDVDPLEHVRRKDAHQALVTAFRARDPQIAAAACEEHLAHNEDLAARALTSPACAAD